MDYQLIDYSKWDISGKGKNITCFLNEIEKKIWKSASPYQDKRQDIGHGEIVTYFALMLLSYYYKTDRKIVIPAAICHDVGWYKTPRETRIDSAAERLDKKEEKIVRKMHETEGVKLTREILKKVSYDTKLTKKILKIKKTKGTTP